MQSVVVTLSTKAGMVESLTRPLDEVLRENLADARDIQRAVSENKTFKADIGSGWRITVARA